MPAVTADRVICFALYTVHDNVLKLTAQLYPLPAGATHTVRLEIQEGDRWREIARTQVIESGWTAPFRVQGWDSTRRVRYRVAHGDTAFYTGTIRKDPIDEETIVVAAFTGNSILARHGGDIAKTDIIDNLRRLDPDLLFFSGDQVYNHTQHYAHWLKFGRDFGDIIRDHPTICIPDDHDVGHGNLWGAGGKKSHATDGTDGGYMMPVEYVKQVERAQTSHLPDPYDPTPIDRGIGVYYTNLTWGRIGFAIVEDRKWKSGPAGLVPPTGPRPDHVTTPEYDPRDLDVEGAMLLGKRQLNFLRKWAADWTGVDMKAVLSQTVFCGGAHLHGKRTNRVYADLDSNGWPQSGRNRALKEIRKAFAIMIAGDQHLGSIIHHGIDDWNDAGYSFCVPSIANLYLRWWKPLQPGAARLPGMPDYTGRFEDGLGNKITVWAMANPSPEENEDKLTTRAAGFGVVRFHRGSRTITMECWPRQKDITDPATQQYRGWPKTIDQQDNYGRQAAAYLPTLHISGRMDPVVQVIDESSREIVYTLRIQGNTFRPRVFKEGSYAVVIGEGERRKTLPGIQSVGEDSNRKLEVSLR